MKRINISELKRLPKEGFIALVGTEIFADGESIGFFGAKKDFIYIGDLHRRVQNSFRAMEQKVRKGMPVAEKIEAITLAV